MPELTCADVSELSGLYVLDALEPADREAVRAHLATCPEAHQEVRELGTAVPALAATAEPLDAPPELKTRVMAAIAAEPRATTREVAVSRDRPVGSSRAAPQVERAASWRVPAWASWAAAVAAVLILAVVGVWAIGVKSQADQTAQRDAILSEAIAAFSAPGSSVAVIRPSGTGTTSGNGFAAVTAEGKAYLVMVGLPQAPQGQAYQAWFIRDNRPTSAGLMSVDSDGYGVMSNPSALAGVQVIALTVERAGGSDQPTSAPFALGEVHPT
jgi:anti-sigma-K factor RskA